MERFDTKLTLTSTETAELLSVSPSTVKRWCNQGELEFETTSGGHRRLLLEDVMDFARARDLDTILTPFRPYEPHVWSAMQAIRQDGSFRELHALAMGWVSRGEFRSLGLLYEAIGRDPSVDLCAFFDEAVRGLMRRVGDSWEQGRLRIGDEHLVSQVMLEVLLGMRSTRRAPSGANNGAPSRVAVVGASEGSRHHLGALCIRLALERKGWDVLFLGADAPLEDLAAIQSARGASLMCVSVAPHPTPGDLARTIRVLGGLYDRTHAYSLELGGAIEGQLPPDLLRGPFEHLGVHDSCASLCAFVDARFPARSTDRGT